MADNKSGDKAPESRKGKAKDLSDKGQKQQDVSYEWQEDVNETFSDLMAQRNETIPPMSELLKDVVKISTTDKPGKPESTTNDPDLLDLETLVEEQLNQMSSDNAVTPTQPKKPQFSDLSSSPEEKSHDYQKSYASQQEAAELRDEFATISARMSNLEATIEGMMMERKNLPEHLERLNISITSQFTLMNDRLNAAIESGIAKESAQQISETVTETSHSSEQVLNTVKADLTNPPSRVSQVAQSKPITGKKKRVVLLD